MSIDISSEKFHFLVQFKRSVKVCSFHGFSNDTLSTFILQGKLMSIASTQREKYY